MMELDALRNEIPDTVRLIAVSKGQSPEKIREALQAGQVDFGENYVQEWEKKAALFSGEKICWHFLGHLQKNKINKVAGKIGWIHSLDSLELAKALSEKSPRPLQCLLEIRLSPESSKTGLSPEAALALIPKLKDLSNIDLRGLMTIPPLQDDPEQSRPFFRELFNLLKGINRLYLREKPLTELSMGMSRDFRVAIEEGATMVRVGEALFGKRAK